MSALFRICAAALALALPLRAGATDVLAIEKIGRAHV